MKARAPIVPEPTLTDRMRRLFRRSIAGTGEAAVTTAPVPHACGATHAGNVRATNQDCLHVAQDGTAIVVADGMGGHQAGEVASRLAVETVAQRLASPTDGLDPGAQLLAAFHEAHDVVLRTSRERAECHGMGTTLIAALVAGGRAYVCHVGDVRGYLWHDGALVRLTMDHSLVAQLVAGGKLTAEEALVHPRRNEILQAVGVDSAVTPDVCVRALDAGDRILLCSDGLWSVVPEDVIAGALGTAAPLLAVAARLIARAMDAGAPDNVTIALYAHTGTSGSGKDATGAYRDHDGTADDTGSRASGASSSARDVAPILWASDSIRPPA